MESVTELGDALSKKTLTRADALKELANVTEKLKDELKEFGKDPAFKKLEQTARSGGGNDSQNLTGLQKQIDSLQKQMGTPTGNPDALDKIKKELDKLKEAAQSMANQNSPMSDAEKQKLSESLSALSKQMQAMGMQLPQLDDAIEALAANQTDMVLKDLDASHKRLEDTVKTLRVRTDIRTGYPAADAITALERQGVLEGDLGVGDGGALEEGLAADRLGRLAVGDGDAGLVGIEGAEVLGEDAVEQDVGEDRAALLHGDPDDVVELAVLDAAQRAAAARGR
jgi:hypothetical protein